MIKKILDWILGKTDTSTSHPLDGATRAAQERVQAPYKVETPPVPTETPSVDAAAMGFTQIAAACPVDTPVVETKPVTVKAKYKKADLNKKTKKELLGLAVQHGLEVKSRVTKDELVKLLAKV